MRKNFLRFMVPVVLSGVTVASLGGCAKESPTSSIPAAKVAPAATTAADESCNVENNWCVEHGVPEDVCGLCNPKVAAEMKKKGDWCKEHDRPESQCFLCNPKRQAKFAAEYEAKHGKKPPSPQTK